MLMTRVMEQALSFPERMSTGPVKRRHKRGTAQPDKMGLPLDTHLPSVAASQIPIRGAELVTVPLHFGYHQVYFSGPWNTIGHFARH